MRLLLAIALCLTFAVAADAQRLQTPNSSGEPTPAFRLMAYDGPSAGAGNFALPAPRVTSPDPAQENSYDLMVTRQMKAFDQAFASQGLSRTGSVVRGSLPNGKYTEYAYRLTAGHQYGFAGVCDQDCSDLDLVLLNNEGQIVKRDVQSDDKPVIIFRPSESGEYRLRVGMASCSDSPCRYGFAAYIPTADSSRDEDDDNSSATTDSNKYDVMVTRQMNAFDQVFASQGLSRVGEVVRGSLAAGRQSVYVYRLTAGHLYGFAGVCDQDCSDLDLVLVNNEGQIVRRDVQTDDKPIVAFRPSESGEYRLQVRMVRCSQSPCRFGFATYLPRATTSSGSKKF